MPGSMPYGLSDPAGICAHTEEARRNVFHPFLTMTGEVPDDLSCGH
jgi:hypothetical protein